MVTEAAGISVGFTSGDSCSTGSSFFITVPVFVFVSVVAFFVELRLRFFLMAGSSVLLFLFVCSSTLRLKTGDGMGL